MLLDQDVIDVKYTATLLESTRLTPSDTVEVRHLVLELPPDGAVFHEGQCLAVLVGGPHEFGNNVHVRLYSVASERAGENGRPGTISLCVRRCSYIDPVNGEEYPGVASNFLCNAQPGDQVTIAGPYGPQFTIPPDPSCNLLMIGTGTGIAPFRAFVRRIYNQAGGWQGKVRLFYGARTGMEMLYRNDMKDDLNLYYDEATFKAFHAVSKHPWLNEAPALEEAIGSNAQEVWEMVQDPKTYVFVAGQVDAATKFENVMATMAGSQEAWAHRRWTMMKQQRYAQLLHE